MSFKEIKRKWDKLTEGWFGLIIYIFVGYIVAYSMIIGLGVALNTNTPVVSVFSCSMEHETNGLCVISPMPMSPDIICNQRVNDYDNSFDSYWNVCGDWYTKNSFTKDDFNKWRFSDGLSIGDMLVVYNDKNYKIGDIVVITTPSLGQPVIHRVIAVDSDTITTKGDRNPVQDAPTPKNLVHGKALIRLPLLGWVKLVFSMTTGIA